MEQAVNQFNKGLLSDTHPMVLGNDTLSDALNATFVTMNGNEVVLQNDMGNRRVDNAFLPPGYEPVGMKEYGGIIYVASYNPITNRSQIGSFPSPERKINSLDDDSLGCEFNLFKHFYENDNHPIKFIKSDTALLPLTSDLSLHAGDKFTIYSDQIENWKTYLSNYDNIASDLSGKVKSPKNNYITLSVGVLNSQNLFVDITKTLKRWDNSLIPSKEKKYDSTYSDLYKFNDGYFICNSALNNELDYTISDRQLIKERLISPANTYAYKLVGPLYLKAHLNHIQEFSFGITGDKDPEHYTLNLIITADIIYNCPDGSEDSDGLEDPGNPFNENYKYDGCGQIQGNWGVYNSSIRQAFDFYRKKSDETYSKLTNYIQSIEYDTPIYNNGTYKTTITMKWLDTNYSKPMKGDDAKFGYFIGVDSGIPLNVLPNNSPYYIESLSTYGEIDLNKLGSGLVYLNSFRFFNNIELRITTISYSLDAYPRIGEKFNGIYFYFINVEDPSDSIIVYKNDNGDFPVNNGRNIVSFSWDVNKKQKIDPGKLYNVIIYVLSSLNGNPVATFNRWFLSTELFNDCYNPQSPNFAEDFGEKVYEESDSKYSSLSQELKEWNKKLLDKLIVDFNIEKGDTKLINEKIVCKKSGELIAKLDKVKDKNLRYSVDKIHTIDRRINDTIEIVDRDLYPNSIALKLTRPELSSKVKDFVFSLKDTEVTVVNDRQLETLSPGDSNGFYYMFNENEYNRSPTPLIRCTKKIKGPHDFEVKISCDSIACSVLNSSKTIKNGFAKILSEDFRKVLDNSTSYTGFMATNEDWVGSGQGGADQHHIGIVYNHESISVPIKGDAEASSYMSDKFQKDQDDRVHVDFGHEKIDTRYKEMGNNINRNCTFAYIFSAINVVGRVEEGYTRHLAYVGDLNASDRSGIREVSTEYSTEERKLRNNWNTAGFSPITCCKVWWKNGLSENWVLLNNAKGVFGGNNTYDYMIPDRIYGDKFTYVGEDDFIWSNDANNPSDKKYYNSLDLAKALYNRIYFNDNPELESIIESIISAFSSSFTEASTVKLPNNINKQVLDLIMLFLDPDNKIIYNIYRETTFGENGLTTFDKTCKYTQAYSGKIVININYKPYGEILNVNDKISKILPFKDGITKNIDSGHEITIPISSYEYFEDEIKTILDNDVILNIYLENGSLRDINNNLLSENTIYKVDVEGNIIPIENPPYKVEKINNNLNSLVSIDNVNSPSVSPSRYLRVTGDDHSETILEFAGGNLRTVDSNRFKNL